MSVLFALMFLWRCVEGYPQGFLNDACDMLNPIRSHTLGSQGNEVPYVLLQTAVSYKPGQVINVSIERRSSHTTFEGFLVQALDKMSGRSIGRFLDAEGLTLIDECSVVTQNDKRPKTFVHLAWVAPLNQRGDVVFRGTVIERKNKYFDNLISRLEPPRAAPFLGF